MMANSPLISIRIPPETLERIDQLAQKRCPARRSGKKPNRSQVILDAIEQFLEQSEVQELPISSIEEVSLPEQNSGKGPVVLSDSELSNPNYAVIHTLESDKQGELSSSEVLTDYESVWTQPSCDLDQNLSDLEVSSTRKYIDLWLDYFSYMGKLAKPWFISRS